MTLSYGQIFSSFKKENQALAYYRSNFNQAQENLSFAQEVKEKAQHELMDEHTLNWEEGPNKTLLERLYSLEEFKDMDPVFKFSDPQKALQLMQRIEQYYANCQHDTELKKNLYQEKKTSLMQSHNDLVQKINELSRTMSCFLR